MLVVVVIVVVLVPVRVLVLGVGAMLVLVLVLMPMVRRHEQLLVSRREPRAGRASRTDGEQGTWRAGERHGIWSPW